MSETEIKTDERFLSSDEAAKFLGVSRTWINEEVNAGMLVYHEIGNRRKFLVSELRLAYPAKRKGVVYCD